MVTDIQNPYRDGRDGKDGAPGASAYDIAVRHGFHGTEAEWLESLHGKDGRDGLSLPGEKGEPGAQGLNGRDAYELSVAAGFHGTREEWLQSLKTLGLNRQQLQHELLESSTAENMDMETALKTSDKRIVGAINETLITAQTGTRGAMNAIASLMQTVIMLSARIAALEQSAQK